MSAIYNIRNPWRVRLLSAPASFRAVMFHVETGERNSGRRTVLHEYPKRNEPYAEDMGKHARRFNFSGYLIYKPPGGAEPASSIRYDYVVRRDALYNALEEDDAGWLVHPVFCPGGILAMCERYSMQESRERGGYTQFEMQFVEAGNPVSAFGVSVDTKNNVVEKATGTNAAAKSELSTQMTNTGWASPTQRA